MATSAHVRAVIGKNWAPETWGGGTEDSELPDLLRSSGPAEVSPGPLWRRSSLAWSCAGPSLEVDTLQGGASPPRDHLPHLTPSDVLSALVVSARDDFVPEGISDNVKWGHFLKLHFY